MKRFSSSDSLGSLLYLQEEKAKDKMAYGNEFQAMLDGLDDEESFEESGHGFGKKRRLSVQQVQSLEKIFEVDNKLDPERKVKLAQELGLQPRQVAIWFQNRRARWKTKQLERDYNILKADYENLQVNFSRVEQEREELVAEVKGLKEKIGGNTEWDHSAGKATIFSTQNSAYKHFDDSSELPSKPAISPLNNEIFHKINPTTPISSSAIHEAADMKDGSSDSDSSGILNEQNNLILHQQFPKPTDSRTPDVSDLSLSSSAYYPQFLNSRTQVTRGHQQNNSLKMEERNLFSLEEACNIFSVDQAPNLCWYFPDQRN